MTTLVLCSSYRKCLFTLRLLQSSSQFGYRTSNLKHFSCIALQAAHTPKDILIPAMPCLCAIIDKSDISRLKHKVQRELVINNRRTPEKLEASRGAGDLSCWKDSALSNRFS